MPNRDGTGPMGAGAMTGRKLGKCTAASAEGIAAVGVPGCRRRAARGRKQGFGYGRGQAGLNQDTVERERPGQQRRLHAGKGNRKFL